MAPSSTSSSEARGQAQSPPTDWEHGHEGTAGAVVSLQGITKSYPGVTALSSVDLDVFRGEVHALVGENGAGKSTLLKIVSGMEAPDAGRIYVNGEEARIESPRVAFAKYSISAVPQELSLVPYMTVAENVCVADMPARRGVISTKMLRKRVEAVLADLGLDIDPMSLLGDHGPSTQQLVMIGRGLVRKAAVIALDEPTAALTAPEIENLFRVIRRAVAAGVAFLYVSHRIQELYEIADRITVLRDGERIVSGWISGFAQDDIIRAMVGRPLEAFSRVRATSRQEVHDEAGPAAKPPPRLRVEGLTRRGVFDDVSFSIERGEIVGLAGLVGAGRTEVARAIFGLDPLDGGRIALDGQTVKIRSPRDAVRAGIAMIPEERKSQALVLEMSVRDNFTLAHLGAVATAGWLRPQRAELEARRQADRVGLRPPRTDIAINNLSGGNQQKVVIGRWLFSPGHASHRVIICDEPTRGVDVGAKFSIYQLLTENSTTGTGVLLISSELLELLSICDRIFVMREGRLIDEVVVDESVTEERILRSAMASHRRAA